MLFEHFRLSITPLFSMSIYATRSIYSDGVVLNTPPLVGREYPVLKCRACYYCFFALQPDRVWTRCFVSVLIRFLDDPKHIDVNKKTHVSPS